MPNFRNPRRVLDLDAIQPNLRIAEVPGENLRYVCLSHCWGDSRVIATTESTVEAFSNAIVFAHLPRTFQEAIICTRKLGIRYLWIDSLYVSRNQQRALDTDEH
jgi:hypothetical protein